MNKKIVSLLIVLLISISGLVQAMDSSPGTSEETAALGVLSQYDVACIEKKVKVTRQMGAILRVLYNRAMNAKNEEDVTSILQTYEAINTMEAAGAAVELAGLVATVAAEKAKNSGNQEAFMTVQADFVNKGDAFYIACERAMAAMRAEAEKLRRDKDPNVYFFQGM